MRSRASQARALFRVISAQSSSSSSSASTATATASGSTSTTSTVAPTAARSIRGSIPSTRRRRQISAAHAAASLASSSSTSPFKSRSRIDNKSDKLHRTIFINTSSSKENQSAGQSVISGLQPVQPPRTSLTSVATQAFFALDRPLLEHVVTSEASSSSPLNSLLQSATESEAGEDIKTSLETASDAIREVASHASRLSADELSRTTFVISRSKEDNEAFTDHSPAKRVASIGSQRFAKLIDNLAKTGSGIDVVEREADALEKEAATQRDIETAVANALERGEDATAARALGSEAELVVLGEPKGPNPEWPRGVATYLAEKTRALEAPALPAPRDAQTQGQEQAMERLELEDLVKHFGNGFSVQNVNEDDPTLLLSHAMVQAILPSRLRWDGVVAKMDAAAESVPSSSSANAVDVTTLNADLLPAAEETSQEDQVHMDSVKRKRRKKMRKHKYRKFRKATRTERNRLKK